MLTALAFPVVEKFYPLFGGNIDVPSYLAVRGGGLTLVVFTELLGPHVFHARLRPFCCRYDIFC
jgi:hypothetical protein